MHVLRHKNSPKNTCSLERQPLAIPHKDIKISSFFNQTLIPVGRVYAHCSNPSHRSPIDITLRPSATFSTPKGSLYATSHSYSDTFRGREDTLTKILKFNQSTASAKHRGITLPDDRSLDLKSNTEDINQKFSKKSNLISKMNVQPHHPGVDIVRKEIEDKFHRTRLILKEENKLQQYQKIQKIYESKYKSRIKAKKPMVKEKSYYTCSPWHKVRIDSGFPD